MSARPLRTCVLLAIAAALLVLALPADGVESGVSEDPPELLGRAPATVLVDAAAPRARVPRRFLGLSFELSSARQIAEYGNRGNLATLLRSLGPGVLRLGGASADTRVAWTDARTPRPAWASRVIGPADLRGLRRLAERSGWRVLLTIGLVHYDSRAASREALAAKRTLGPWLAGIEVGNEPDSYAQHGLRALPWLPSEYEAQVSAYRRAIAARAPGLALAGPGVSGSRAYESWGPAEVRRQKPALLTGHHYPLSCKAVPAPSIEALLSPYTREQEAASLQRYMAVARASATPFRMDETNTVSCGGKAGISDTFASALWALAYITQNMARGVSGMNFQGNPANCRGYSPVCASSMALLARGSLHAQPEWYALLAARALIGDRPLPSRVLSPKPADLSLSALLTPAGALHIVIVQDSPPGSSPTKLRVRVGRPFHSASVLALRAPSLMARAGVTLGGREVGADGSWRAPASTSSITVSNGVLPLTVPAGSAMVLTVTSAHRAG